MEGSLPHHNTQDQIYPALMMPYCSQLLPKLLAASCQLEENTAAAQNRDVRLFANMLLASKVGGPGNKCICSLVEPQFYSVQAVDRAAQLFPESIVPCVAVPLYAWMDCRLRSRCGNNVYRIKTLPTDISTLPPFLPLANHKPHTFPRTHSTENQPRSVAGC